MKRIVCNGHIVSSEDENIFSYFGLTYFSPRVLRRQLEEAKGDEIVLEINSAGGDVFAAVEIRNELKKYKGRTTAEITGLAASAATIVMTGCKNVVATLGSQLMIHNTETFANGDYRALEAATQMLITSRENLIDIYQEKTGKDRIELAALLDKETWMSAKDALEMKFVDAIKDDELGNLRIAASFDKLDYRNMKEAYLAATKREEKNNDNWQNRASARLQIEKVRFGAERDQNEKID